MRKIAVITGTRAEYGLLYWIIRGIHEDPELILQLIVTGMHLSNEFGLTVKEIEKDEFPIAERVEMLLSSDSEIAIATSMGLGMIGFAKVYERLNPDILLALGDRFEILSAIVAAVPYRIPIAHIHGGETTEGAIDELFRHAMTKMSHIHFTANQIYADRIIQMGESPKSVFCFEAPGLDNIYLKKLLDKQQLATALDLPAEKAWGIVTYHPLTLERDSTQVQINELLDALESLSEFYWIFTMPNADTESRIIMDAIKDYVHRNPNRVKAFISLGQLNYLSMLKNAIVMVGNSSSGIIEAPSFELPVVNIGDRQNGRIKAKNVIDVPRCDKNLIINAVSKAISKDFRTSLKGLKNPYGDGGASEKIVKTLKTISLSDRVKKKFYELKAKES